MPARSSCLSESENPSGRTRCRRHPEFAHRRMMLPVFGGISGSNSTISNMSETRKPARYRIRLKRSCHHPTLNFERAALAQVARKFIEGGAGRHHVVDYRDALSLEVGVAHERTPDVLRALAPRQGCLRRAVAPAAAGIRRERHAGRAAHHARDLERLGEA